MTGKSEVSFPVADHPPTKSTVNRSCNLELLVNAMRGWRSQPQSFGKTMGPIRSAILKARVLSKNLAYAFWEMAVLNSRTSPDAQRGYRQAIDEFLAKPIDAQYQYFIRQTEKLQRLQKGQQRFLIRRLQL